MNDIAMTQTAIALPMEKIAEFCQEWNVTELSLFGLILRDDFNDRSDVDVMVQFHPKTHNNTLNNYQYDQRT